MTEGVNDSFLSELLKKEATVRKIFSEKGRPLSDTSALVTEVRRQRKQVGRASGGDLVTGVGVTKSGGDD